MRMRAEAFYRQWVGVGGHFPLRHAYRLGFAQAWRFTFLRDPLERLVSHLVFASLREQPPMDLDFVRPSLADIKDHLRRDLLCSSTSYHNCFAHFLSTTRDERAPRQDQIDSAVENLGAMDFVGYQETFEKDITRLCHLLNVAPPSTVPQENNSRVYPRASLLKNEILADAECRELLWKCTDTDREIYRRVLALREGRPANSSSETRVVVATLPPRMEISAGEIRIVECTLDPNGKVAPGSQMEFQVLLEVGVPDFPFDLLLTVEATIDHDALVQLYTFNHKIGRQCLAPGLFLFRIQMPCWLNEGSYVAHLAVLSAQREAVAEKINAFAFTVATKQQPGQFGLLYADAEITAEEVSLKRRLPIGDAQKLVLCSDSQLEATWYAGNWCIPLTLRNFSAFTISSSAECRCFVSCHLVGRDGEIVAYEGPRHALPPIAPLQDHSFVFRISADDVRGASSIQMRILQENVRWHEGEDFKEVVLADIVLDLARSLQSLTG